MNKTLNYFAAIAFGCFLTSEVHAAPISYEGELFDDSVETGEISNSDSDWWFFEAQAGDIITLRVDRLEFGLDPAMYLYAGLGSNSNELTQIGFADDEIPHPGPWGDPEFLNFEIETAGFYSVNVWDYASYNWQAPFDYEISLNGITTAEVPLPSSVLLFACSLFGMGAARKRKLKQA